MDDNILQRLIRIEEKVDKLLKQFEKPKSKYTCMSCGAAMDEDQYFCSSSCETDYSYDAYYGIDEEGQ